MIDKRKYKRVPCKLKLIDLASKNEYTIMDISKNGAKVKTYSDVEEMDRGVNPLKIKLPARLPGHSDIKISGKLRWISKVDNEVFAGIEFIYLEMNDMFALNYLISSVLLKKYKNT